MFDGSFCFFLHSLELTCVFCTSKGPGLGILRLSMPVTNVCFLSVLYIFSWMFSVFFLLSYYESVKGMRQLTVSGNIKTRPVEVLQKLMFLITEVIRINLG